MKKIYKVTQEQLTKLQNGDTITVGGISYTYETGADVAYIVVDPTHPEYTLRNGSNDNLELLKDATVISDLTVNFAARAGYATNAHTLKSATETNSFDIDSGGSIRGNVTMHNDLSVERSASFGGDHRTTPVTIQYDNNQAYAIQVTDTSTGSTTQIEVPGDGTQNDVTITFPSGDGKLALTSDIPTIDSALSSTSTNPVQNKVINTALGTKQNTISSTNKLAASLVSGLATVATSGSYNDLSNKPTIPTVNNGTLTIQTEGTSKGTFTANQSGNTTINIKASDLGLSAAMKFLGTTTTAISDGSTTNPITIDSKSITVVAGNVILYGSKEFVWTGSLWEELGDEGSHALKSVTITGTGALGGGGSLEANREITHNTTTRTNTTSTATPNYGGTFTAIDSVESDSYGHISKVNTKTITMPSSITIDTALSSTSTNPVQNKVINTALGNKQDKITTTNKLSSSLVDGLSKVATSGSYNDLSNTPTIPTVNNGTLTIQKNGTTIQTFTANSSTNVNADITVPTKVSELSNDSGYTTNTGTVTSVAVKLNGTVKGTVTTSGTIDLGDIPDSDITYNIATSSTAGLVKSTTTGTTTGRDYNVQVNTDGTMKVNVPWTDTNTTYSFSANNPTLAWGTTSTIGTAGGATYKVTMPANPNTDTHYTAYNYVGAAGSASNAATSNGSTYLKLYENGTKRSQFLIKGSNTNLVSSDSSGNITINSRLVQVQTSSNSSTSGSSGISSLICKGYDIEYDPVNTTSASSHKMLFIRSGNFKSSGTGDKSISFTSPMKMNSTSAIYVTVYLQDATNMSQNGPYKNAHNITATSSTGFSCYINNSETGVIHFLAIGYNFY